MVDLLPPLLSLMLPLLLPLPGSNTCRPHPSLPPRCAALRQAKTARQGVELLGKYVQDLGSAEGFGIQFADRDEAWCARRGGFFVNAHDVCRGAGRRAPGAPRLAPAGADEPAAPVAWRGAHVAPPPALQVL